MGTVADSAMVVSAHPLATAVGVEIMQRGGNAIDAAVGVQFALAVVYPVAGNIGGGGFMMTRMHNGEVTALDYREKAPLAAHRDMYLNDSGQVIEDLSVLGHLAAGVPGTVAGMWEAHQRYGQLPWAQVVEPAVRLAAEGFLLTEKEAESYNGHAEQLVQYNTVAPAFLLKAEGWQPGDTVRMPELASTLMAIRDHGMDGFYRGPVADLLIAEMARGQGMITHEDLQTYTAEWRTPVATQYRGHHIFSMPPPSSGGIALAQLLTLLEGYPLADWAPHSVEKVHLVAEAERRVYADRATHLGDSDFWEVPMAQLTDSLYLMTRMLTFDPERATPSDSVLAGQFAVAESEQTTHYSIVDAQGNAVSVTTTLNGSMGSHVVVAGAGFLLNNEMDDFSIKPGVPNSYGLVGGEANAIAAGKRMLSSMSPTLVEKEGQLYLVVGTPGGSTIITSVLQTIVNVMDHGMNMQQAVAYPRFHHQWRPDQIFVEAEALDAKTRAALRALGHTVVERESIGRVDAILIRDDGKLEGGADPRGDDTALGY